MNINVEVGKNNLYHILNANQKLNKATTANVKGYNSAIFKLKKMTFVVE